MCEQELHHDADFKNFLEIVRSYLYQIQDQDIIELCNAWVQKLCNSKRNEKVLRNKYIFTLCYQLAKGVLEDPFVNKPDFDELPPLLDQICDESSEMKIKCILVDLDNTKIPINNDVSFARKNCLDSSDVTKCKENLEGNSEEQSHSTANSILNIGHNIALNMSMTQDNNNNVSRTANLIMKIRSMKEENLRLHEELARHKESQMNNKCNDFYNEKIKLDSSTSTYIPSESSSTTLKSLKCKLEECQTSRNQLIENISKLKEKLDNYEDLKKYEIEDLQTKHKMEIIQIETNVREELKTMYEKKLAEVKSLYEEAIKTIEKTKQEVHEITTSKDEIISQRDTIIKKQNDEIAQLKVYIEYLEHHQTSDNKFQRTDLEKRLYKLDKSKTKCCKVYEAKILNLKREKHLAECSLQLQLIKQRAQIMNEVTCEHEKDISNVLEKLENKYKDIVASVQATAVQRKIQDQMALESLIQSMCGIRKEAQTEKQTISQKEPSEIEFPTVTQKNRSGSVIVGNNRPTTDNDFCFDTVRIEDIEKVHIPQRDSNS